mgnify:CR=1 FL=1
MSLKSTILALLCAAIACGSAFATPAMPESRSKAEQMAALRALEVLRA